MTGTSEILWDAYRVPHVFATNTLDLFYAFGWSQMEAHGNLILRLYGQARGQAAEYWGIDFLMSDVWVQQVSIPTRAQTWHEAQTPQFRDYLDAFVGGMNDYAEANPGLIDEKLKIVLPINSVDVLAHSQRVVNFMFVVERGGVIDLAKSGPPIGSNAWAIGPSRSATGNAMLLANPHLPWADVFLLLEAHLNCPGINIYGATLVGFPVLAFAFNDFLGWTHTVNTYRGWTLYQLELADGGYNLDGQTLAFGIKEHTLKVRLKDGSLLNESLVVRSSIHGPVVAEQDGLPLALRIAGLDRPRALEQWWNMAVATNLFEFEVAVKDMQIPLFTIIYADQDGHIMHLFNAQVPIRNEGDVAYWEGLIPGNTSANIWTETHPYEDLPCVIDPASGWLQNANDPPWTTTFPPALNPEEYPSYMAPRGPMSMRAQRSARILLQAQKVSLEELIGLKFSTHVELADRILDDLISLARPSSSPTIRRAAEVLSSWDRKTEHSSRGAVLFQFWAQAMQVDQLFATTWDENFPVTTPHGLGDRASALAALETAALLVQAKYGALDVRWGDVFQLRPEGMNILGCVADNVLGIFPELWYTATEDNRFVAIGGDSYTAAIEFSKPLRAKVLTIYGKGNESNSISEHGQFEMFAQKQLRPAWLTREEVMDHLADRETCNYSDRVIQRLARSSQQ
jgi:acyl-homoserine-lactone acylase